MAFVLMNLVLFCTLVAACIAAPNNYEAKVDKVLNQALACRRDKNPGLTVSVVKDGNVLLAKGYGLADVASGRKVTNTTLFGVASVSKAFTATLMLKQLHDQHKSIYTKPGDILSEDFRFNTSTFTDHATVRDLLTHCLAVPANNYMRLDPTLSTKEMARRVRYFKPIYPFRVHYLYSNLHYGIVSYLSEVLGGHSWEDLVQDQLYRPLGMVLSDFWTRINPQHKDVAQGYADDEVNGGIVPVPIQMNKFWGKNLGSTGVLSNAVDMTKWMKFHLSKGQNEHGVQMVESSTLYHMYSSQTPIRASTVEKEFHVPVVPHTTTEVAYGMGFKIGYYRGYHLLRHTGTTWGYSSLLTLIPSMNLGIFTSMTGEDENYVFRTLLHNFLVDTFLDLDVWLNETTICSFPEPWQRAPHTSHSPVDKTITPSRPLASYVGTYQHDAYGKLTVSRNATSGKHLQLTYGAGMWTLYPKHVSDHFRGVGFGMINELMDMPDVIFKHNTHNGHMQIELPSFESKGHPIFNRVDVHVHGTNPAVVG